MVSRLCLVVFLAFAGWPSTPWPAGRAGLAFVEARLDVSGLAQELAACAGSRSGLGLPRVRRHLLRHFGGRRGGAGEEEPPFASASAARAAAAAAQAALFADGLLDQEALWEIQTGVMRLRIPGYHCRLAGAALRLLRCALPPTAGRLCSFEDMEEDLRLAVGLDPDIGPVDILRSQWPTHALAAAAVASAQGDTEATASWSLGRRLEGLLTGHSAMEERARVLAALDSPCPFKPPYEAVLCRGQASHESHLEVASFYAALAAEAARERRRVEPTDLECAELTRLCSAASLGAAVEKHLTEATAALARALGDGSGDPLAVGRLADVGWPALGLLARVLTDSLRGPGEEKSCEASSCSALGASSGQMEEQPTTAAAPLLSGPCACDTRTWHTETGRAVAASLRLLRQLHNSRRDADGIFAAAQAEDAAISCPVAPDAEVPIAVLQTMAVAFHAVQGLWAGDDSEQQQLEAARRSMIAPEEDFASDVCAPGALAISLACLVVVVEKRMWYWASVISHMARALLLGTTQCALPEETGAQTRLDAYLSDWKVLAAWQQDPPSFVDDIVGPFIESDLWWRGREPPQDPPRMAMNLSLSRCAGLADGREGCETVDIAGDGVVARGPVSAPLTRILGVGLMKAGSTLVLQALRAATDLPIGMDCGAPGAIWAVEQGREPLARALRDCSEEVFKWELAKDPLLTPLAGRLAASWPAISQTGDKLRLYFLARGPFDFVRSFLRHLQLAVDGGPSKPAQKFSLGNWPNHMRFTPAKQLYLDVGQHGLRYSGYVDAAAQRWALTVDVYLHCPSNFALVRYEDFSADPAGATSLLLKQLGLWHLWSDAAADRVRQASAVRYQALKNAPSGRDGDAASDFGPRLHRRLADAVRERAALLGYGHALGPAARARAPEEKQSEADEPEDPIDVPPLPVPSCGA